MSICVDELRDRLADLDGSLSVKLHGAQYIEIVDEEQGCVDSILVNTKSSFVSIRELTLENKISQLEGIARDLVDTYLKALLLPTGKAQTALLVKGLDLQYKLREICEHDTFPPLPGINEDLERRYKSLVKITQDMYKAMAPMHEPCCEDVCLNLGDDGWNGDYCFQGFVSRLNELGIPLGFDEETSDQASGDVPIHNTHDASEEVK